MDFVSAHKQIAYIKYYIKIASPTKLMQEYYIYT